jgi:glycosyltransferase involved in cell wall biosynthesis
MRDNNLGKLAVIIPLHQEEGIAQELGAKILASLAETKELNYILVCDNCTDNTNNFLSAALSNEGRAYVVPSNREKGYGNAINFGCEYALEKGFEWALITDSDMSNPLRENPKFLHEISGVNPDERIAIIKGNRFHRFPPALYDVPIRRMILTTLANIFCRLILNSRGGGAKTLPMGSVQ